VEAGERRFCFTARGGHRSRKREDLPRPWLARLSATYLYLMGRRSPWPAMAAFGFSHARRREDNESLPASMVARGHP
jgi:hypothetical protein